MTIIRTAGVCVLPSRETTLFRPVVSSSGFHEIGVSLYPSSAQGQPCQSSWSPCLWCTRSLSVRNTDSVIKVAEAAWAFLFGVS